MPFQSFEQALEACLNAPPGSQEQDAALMYCMENAPEDLKALLRQKFIEFHRGRGEHCHQHGPGESCGCQVEKQEPKPGLSDFIK